MSSVPVPKQTKNHAQPFEDHNPILELAQIPTPQGILFPVSLSSWLKFSLPTLRLLTPTAHCCTPQFGLWLCPLFSLGLNTSFKTLSDVQHLGNLPPGDSMSLPQTPPSICSWNPNKCCVIAPRPFGSLEPMRDGRGAVITKSVRF